jgi:hypothetical protein
MKTSIRIILPIHNMAEDPALHPFNGPITNPVILARYPDSI